MKHVEEIPFEEARNPEKADIIFSDKNQSFYRRDSEGREYCWMAVDADTGTIEFKDPEGKSLLVLDAESKKLSIGADGSDLIGMIENASRKPELPAYLTQSKLNQAYETKDKRKADIDKSKAFVERFEDRYGKDIESLKTKVGNDHRGLVKDNNFLSELIKENGKGAEIAKELEINGPLKIKGSNLLVDDKEITPTYSSLGFYKDLDFSYGEPERFTEIAYHWAHETYVGRQLMFVADFRNCKTSRDFSIKNSQGLIFKITKEEEDDREVDWNGPFDLPFAECGITQVLSYFDKPTKRTTYRLKVRLRNSLVGHMSVKGFFKMIAL